MLETAKLVTDVYEGVGDETLSTTTVVYDASMRYPVGTFSGGTLWSANADTGIVEILTQGQNTITAIAAQTSALSGVYQMADTTFPMRKLKQAVLYVLRNMEIPAIDETLAASDGSIQIYDPDNNLAISNVRRVDVDGVRNYHWREQDGYLYFDDPDLEGDLKIYYMTNAQVAEYDDPISEAIDLNYLTWSAAAFLWRDHLRKVRKDNPTAQDMLNEAKINEAEALRMARKYEMRRLPRDPHHARW